MIPGSYQRRVAHLALGMVARQQKRRCQGHVVTRAERRPNDLVLALRDPKPSSMITPKISCMKEDNLGPVKIHRSE